MNLVQMKKPFVPSIDRAAIVKVLAATEPNAVLTFPAVSESIGRDVRGCRWLLEGARREVRAKHGIVFEAVVGVGLRRLPNQEIPSRGTRALRRARRAVSRGVKDVKCAEYDALPESARAEFNMTLSLSGAMLLMTKPARMKKLETAATVRFDPGETLRLLLGPKKSSKEE